jgi:tetratricopeptide (TPR) repeat protein
LPLSNKKSKAVRRHAGKKTARQIADELKISVRDVEKVLAKSGAAATRSGADTVFLTPANVDAVFFRAVALFAAIAPFVHKEATYDFANLPQSIWIQCGVLFFAVVWFAKSTARERAEFLPTPFFLPLAVFLGWAALSLFWAENRFEGATALLHWVACALGGLVVANALRDKEDPVRFLRMLLLSGLFVALLGIGQHLLNVQWVPQVVPPSATFANRNMAVHYMVLTAPLGAAFFLRAKNPVAAWGYALLSGTLLLYLLYMDNRTGLLAFTLMLLLMGGLTLWLTLKQGLGLSWNPHKTLAAITTLVLVFILFNLTPNGFEWKAGDMYHRVYDAAHTFLAVEEQTPEQLEKEVAKAKQEAEAKDPAPEEAPKGETGAVDTSAKLRRAIFLNTIEMIKDRPLFGFGLGNHKVWYPLYVRKKVVEEVFSEDAQLNNVHNDHLQAASETGLIGYAMLVWLAVVAGLAAYRLFKSAALGQDRHFVVGMITALVGININSLFCFPFQRAVPPLVVMSFLGLLGFWLLQEGKTKTRVFPRNAGPVFAIFTLGALIYLAQTNRSWLESDAHYLRMTSAEKGGYWGTVIREGQEAIRHNPNRSKIYSYLGRAYVESNQPEKGVEALQKVIEAYPNHMNALLNLGVAYGNMNNYEKALETYAKVVEIKPDYGKVHNNIANVLMRQDKLKEALGEFAIAAKYDPKNAVVHFNAGIVALRLQDYPEAEKRFRRAVDLKPSWAAAQRNLGIVLVRYLKKPDEGAKHLAEAEKLEKAEQEMKERTQGTARPQARPWTPGKAGTALPVRPATPAP